MQTSLDSVRRGELTLEQPRSGYRFSIDPLLLADFTAGAVAQPPARVVDLGAGVGVVGLLLARRWPAARVLLVELQPELAELAERNIRRNGLSERVEARCLDLREVERWRDFTPELAVSNPPFYRVGSGRSSKQEQISLARHEHACSLADLVGAARAGAGALALIHAADRESEILEAIAREGLVPRALRRVVPFPEREPNRLLLHAGDPGSLHALPPLVVEARPGEYTEETRRLLGEA